jgi:hypothetical protein
MGILLKPLVRALVLVVDVVPERLLLPRRFGFLLWNRPSSQYWLNVIAAVTRIANTTKCSRPCLFDPVPTTQSSTCATLRSRGLHVASVQNPKKGLGAKP